MNNSLASTWKQILRTNFIEWEKLANFLELDESQRQQILINPKFPLNLPLRLAKKIPKNTLNDPILKQFLPTHAETSFSQGFFTDPVKDHQFQRQPKLLHKYNGRALLVCTGACAMNCRFCFRQNFDYERDPSFENELQMIAEDSSIREIILSGGDPLTLPDRKLQDLIEKLSKIPHINRIRFHTRFPIGIPERINETLVEMLSNACQIWFVIHVNHPRELDNDIFYHLKLLQKRGVVVLNQTVLLRGVNDDEEVLVELCESLVNQGIFPYYLHQLDRVQGAAHFEVSEEEGRALVNSIAKRLPGYGVPKYVKEIPGEPGKTIV